MTKGPKGPFVIESQNDLAVERGLIALATHDAQQSQQALEHIHDVHVQGQGGTDVVGLAAINDLFDVIQHVGAEDTNCQHGDGHHAGR